MDVEAEVVVDSCVPGKEVGVPGHTVADRPLSQLMLPRCTVGKVIMARFARDAYRGRLGGFFDARERSLTHRTRRS